jgi:hypothetical protein
MESVRGIENRESMCATDERAPKRPFIHTDSRLSKRYTFDKAGG